MIQVIDLLPGDYARIADLTLERDFDVYRRFWREPFCRVPLS